MLRAELDAYYAALYGLNRKQLRYILDPADLTPRELENILDPWEEVNDPLDPAGYDARCAASDFPGETFRVLKEKEIKQYGEYRTRRLVLEAWERLKANGELPEPYREETAPAEPQGRETINKVQPRQAVENKTSPAPEKASPPPAPSAQPIDEPEIHPAQPMLTDFGLYKCALCGKMVMGYDRENHARDAHAGKSGVWRKMR